jgi:hypothetical protein
VGQGHDIAQLQHWPLEEQRPVFASHLQSGRRGDRVHRRGLQWPTPTSPTASHDGYVGVAWVLGQVAEHRVIVGDDLVCWHLVGGRLGVHLNHISKRLVDVAAFRAKGYMNAGHGLAVVVVVKVASI